MNIQIFGRGKCFDSKKAERFFKERRIKYQYIDLDRYGMSRGELKSVVSSVGLDKLINEKHPDAAIVSSYAYDEDKLDALFDRPALIKTPVVRNGKTATLGCCPDIWLNWIKAEK
ncbi:MAG: ArsC family transcriptional regulator [Clostridia bacterium]|nr:ArsC family transcriptional regulator [Clostridia bacterium]